MQNNDLLAKVGASRLIPKQMEYQYLEMAHTSYQQSFKESSTARDYLEVERGLEPEVLKRFGIGFCDRSFGKSLPDGDHFDGAMVRGALQRYGILKPNGRELFRGCVVIPVCDEHERLVNAYGRKIQKYQRKGVSFHIRQQLVSTSLFNASALARHKTVTLCSSPIEALTLLSRGAENVVSLMGMGTFNAWHLEQLQRHETEKVLLAVANTHQGQNTAKVVTDSLEVAGIQTERVPLPKTDDLNDLHMKARFSGYVDELFSMMSGGVLN